MCTLTWTNLPTDEGEGPGYKLWFNRDERLTRGPEVPPRVQVTESGTAYIAPEDSEAGGTWIAANEHGVTVALLNGYVEGRGPARTHYTSRGVLVRGLAGVRSPKEALAQLSPKQLSEFRPSVVFVKVPHQPALVVRWDGLSAAVDVMGARQRPLTSSSYEQDKVQQARLALYRRLVLDPGSTEASASPPPDRLADFQNYVDPTDGPTHVTPLMRRSDAATRSQCVITVSVDRVAFGYRAVPEDGPVPSDAAQGLMQTELQRVSS